MHSRWLLTLCAPAALCFAQSAGLQGPSSGVLFDAPSHAIRTVTGVPGSSYLGSPLLSGIDKASVSPDGSLAIVEKDGARFLASGLNSPEPALTALEDIASSPDLIAWSADNLAVALVLKDAAQIRVLKLDAGALASSSSLSLADLPGTLASLALSSRGETLFAGLLAEDSGAIYRSSDSAWTLLSTTKGAPALTLSAKEDLLFAADLATGDLLRIANPASPEAPAPLLWPAQSSQPVLALALSKDSKHLMLALGGDQPSIQIWDPSSQEITATLALDAPPSGLETLPASPYLLLNQRSKPGDIITILAERFAQPGVFFVPVGE